MTNQISVSDIIRCGACDERFQEMLDFLDRHNIDKTSSIDIDEMIGIFNANRMRHFGFWLNEMRAHLLKFTQVKAITYEVQRTSFDTVEAARAHAVLVWEQRKKYHLDFTPVSFSKSLGEDHTWEIVDIDTFVVPDGVTEYHFHVFNHETGLHVEAYTTAEAKEKRDAFVENMLSRDTHMWAIFKKTWFAEHDGAFISEIVE